jgi:hypoxanthine phosphoribosyltransferase
MMPTQQYMKDKMKTVKLSNSDVQKMTMDIIRQITLDGYKPDYVVGITRGGLLPALLISQYFNIPLETLRVSLRDHSQQECNTWMSEDAFGYINSTGQEITKSRWDISKRKNILIVDDINDTGATLEWIKKDWQSSCLPEEKTWETIWNKNVKFAVLVNNEASNVKDIDYASLYVNKAENNKWIEFPWESWWWK